MTLVLASKSTSRQKLLSAAGLDFKARPSQLDEAAIKSEMLAKNSSHQEIAEELATKKAMLVAADHPDATIIGADQILECDGRLFDKAKTAEEAKEHLKFFRGKPHSLITSVVIVRSGKAIWSYTSTPKLTMRDFSNEFLQDYLDNAGSALTSSVGAYFLEDIGIKLFSKIDGDYHAILGLPMIPLLEKLRELNLIDDK